MDLRIRTREIGLYRACRRRLADREGITLDAHLQKLTEVDIAGLGVAQAHLPTTVSVDRIVDAAGENVGVVALQQLREIIADLLGI